MVVVFQGLKVYITLPLTHDNSVPTLSVALDLARRDRLMKAAWPGLRWWIASLVPLLAAAFAVWWVGRPASSDGGGITLVVFGPSSWDTFAPGAPPETVKSVTDALDRRFLQQHPEVRTIVHDSRGTISDGLARLRNSQVAGESVDVIVCAANPVNTAYARLGLIQPLDGLVQPIAERFSEGSLANFTVDGHIWAVPLSAVNVTTFFYNKALFVRLGLAPPQTYEDLRAAVPRLAGAGVVPVVHQGKNPWMWLLYYMNALAQTTGHRQLEFAMDIVAGRARYTDAASMAALRLTRAWVDDGVLDAKSNELDEDAMKSVFYAGRAAAFFGGSWDLPGVSANAPFEWGVFAYPAHAGQPGRPVVYGGAEAGLCLSAHSRHPELAKAYIVFSAGDENVRKLLAPVSPIATSHRRVRGVQTAVAEQLRAGLPAQKFLDWIWPPALTESMQREIQALMGRSQSVEQAAERMQAQADELLAARAKRKRTGKAGA